MPNTRQSALFNTQSFRPNPAKSWAKIGPACVLCDSHIFHLTAEREGEKKSKAWSKLSNLASRPSSSQKRKARCLVEDAQNRKKNTPISNWKSSTKSFKIRLSEGPAGPSKNMSCFRRARKSHLESTKEQNQVTQVFMFLPQGCNTLGQWVSHAFCIIHRSAPSSDWGAFSRTANHQSRETWNVRTIIFQLIEQVSQLPPQSKQCYFEIKITHINHVMCGNLAIYVSGFEFVLGLIVHKCFNRRCLQHWDQFKTQPQHWHLGMWLLADFNTKLLKG